MNKQERFIQEIKGIRRVVINVCHGGFGLSEAAVIRYLELCGQSVWPERDSNKTSTLLGPTYWLIPPDGDRIDATPDNWHEMTIAERTAHNQKWSEQVFYDRDVARDDPYLARTVEELGSDKASGRYSQLKVVEVPADVEWTIEEYDGNEWVAEKHRTWS